MFLMSGGYGTTPPPSPTPQPVVTPGYVQQTDQQYRDCQIWVQRALQAEQRQQTDALAAQDKMRQLEAWLHNYQVGELRLQAENQALRQRQVDLEAQLMQSQVALRDAQARSRQDQTTIAELRAENMAQRQRLEELRITLPDLLELLVVLVVACVAGYMLIERRLAARHQRELAAVRAERDAALEREQQVRDEVRRSRAMYLEALDRANKRMEEVRSRQQSASTASQSFATRLPSPTSHRSAGG
jgi:hypothetical protein